MSKLLSFLVLWFCINIVAISGLREEEKGRPFVKREERRIIFANENGQVTAARVSDRVNGSYLLHFITLEPNSLFLPVLLHADMVFYVHTGAGRLGWNEDDDMKHSEVRKGDVYRLPAGTVFFAKSSLESERQKIRIYAIFATSINDLREPATAPYTSISDLVLGFDKDVLQAAFQVPEYVIEEILSGAKQPAIIHGQHEMEQMVPMWDKEMEYVKQLVGNKGLIKSVINKKKKKDKDEKMYNIMEEDRDFENCNGWSLTVTRNNLDALKGSDIGIFMVNLTKGSMMGPHWNPMATEIAIVLEGQGMVRVVCPKTNANLADCRNMRFHVNEGDVFVVPRFHPMTQIAFNNGSFVFMGFSTSAKNNNPQFLAGKASVLRTLNVDVVAASLNVTNATVAQLLGAQEDLVILECVNCAEEELRIMEEEIEREMDEKRKREEEKARKEEEEASKREEEKARREEEERRRREEEEEAQRKREEEEEEARRQEEERKQREEEEAQRKREEEEAKEREEEEARRQEEGRKQKEQEEEAQRKREEEERREEEEAHREEEGAQSREEEEARRQERARRAREQARRAAEERDRRAQEEARRAAEEERERERRQWEPQEGRGSRAEQGRRQWEPERGRGSRGEREGGGRSSEETGRAAEEERERERRQWEPREGRGSRREREGGERQVGRRKKIEALNYLISLLHNE